MNRNVTVLFSVCGSDLDLKINLDINMINKSNKLTMRIISLTLYFSVQLKYQISFAPFWVNVFS